jgi:hypothetical protein
MSDDVKIFNVCLGLPTVYYFLFHSISLTQGTQFLKLPMHAPCCANPLHFNFVTLTLYLLTYLFVLGQ